MTSGSDVKRRVMEALPLHKGHAAYYPAAHARAALAPCVVLTREEAGAAWQTFSEVVESAYHDDPAGVPLVVQAALALLTPADEGEGGA